MARRISILLLLAGIAGCTDVARWMRQYTYPPDFRYVERDQLRSAMWQLAYHSRELNRVMGVTDNQPPDRAAVIAQLQAMEQAASRLDTTGSRTNHPLIDMNLAKFRRDLRFAREAVERDPPNYLLASHLSGACVYCHGRKD